VSTGGRWRKTRRLQSFPTRKDPVQGRFRAALGPNQPVLSEASKPLDASNTEPASATKLHQIRGRAHALLELASHGPVLGSRRVPASDPASELFRSTSCSIDSSGIQQFLRTAAVQAASPRSPPRRRAKLVSDIHRDGATAEQRAAISVVKQNLECGAPLLRARQGSFLGVDGSGHRPGGRRWEATTPNSALQRSSAP